MTKPDHAVRVLRLTWEMKIPGQPADLGWQPYERVATDDPDEGILAQAETLARWEADGTEPVRNVKLEERVLEPRWVELGPSWREVPL